MKRSIGSYIVISMMSLVMLAFSSCSEEHVIKWVDNETVADSLLKELNLKVVVFNSRHDYLTKDKKEQVAEWIKSLWNTSPLKVKANIDIEWCDADEMNEGALYDYTVQHIHSGEIDALIAPAEFSKQITIAKACDIEGGLLLIPYSVPDSLVREISVNRVDDDDDNFMWVIGESLSTEVQVALSVCSREQSKDIYYVGKNDSETREFAKYLSFETKERGFNSFTSIVYDNEKELSDACSLFECGSDSISILLAPGSDEELLSILEKYSEVRDGKVKEAQIRYPNLNDEYQTYYVDRQMPKLLFIDYPIHEELQEKCAGLFTNNVSVISEVGAPNTGFMEGYHSRIGGYPFDAAYFYDAFHLLLTSKYMQKTAGWDDYLYGNIKQLVFQKKERNNSMAWHPGTTYYRQLLERLTDNETDNTYALGGASGELSSTLEPFIGHTTYDHWTIYKGKIKEIETYSPNPEISDYALDPTYFYSEEYDIKMNYSKTIDDQWAVIIDASPGIDNYRFESSAYAFYRLLKEGYHYDDDHILFIGCDDAAKNNGNMLFVETNNGYSQEDYIRMKNVYQDGVIDWNIHSMTKEECIGAITGEYEGNKSIHPTEKSNVSVFWFGHGTKYGLVWNYSDDYINVDATEHLFGKDDFDALCHKLENTGNGRMFNKLFWFTEACDAGSVVRSGEEKVGMIFLNSCEANEDSRACNNNGENNLCNESSYAIFSKLKDGSNISLYNLYKDVWKNTHGSHPQLLNEEYFGLASQCMMSEFFSSKTKK